MHKLFPSLAFLVLFYVSAHAQSKGSLWYYGLDLQNLNMTQFDYTFGKIGSAEQRLSTQIWLERRFKSKTKGPFTTQNGLRLELQTFSREGQTLQNFPVQSAWFRVPVMWTQTMPRFFKDETHPLFEMQSGIGYHFAYSQYIEAGGLPVAEAPSYWVHGPQALLGINFYIQSGTMINLGWRFAFDLGVIGNEANDPKLFYMDNGFSIGFSSSFADTGRRMRAVKAWRKDKRSRK